MSELPTGWVWSTVDEVSDVAGGVQKSPKRKPRSNAFPMLRVANVLAGRLDLAEVNQIELLEGELDKLRLEPGDVLVVEGNGSVSQVGRVALWKGEIPDCVHQNHIHRVRPSLNPSYLKYWLESPPARSAIQHVASSTSGLYVLSGRKLRRLPVPVAPASEQERIVAAIETCLTRVDAARSNLDLANKKLAALRSKLLADLPPGPPVALGDLAERANYGTSTKCDVDATGPPVLRIPNVGDEAIEVRELKYARDPTDLRPSDFVAEGDVLFVRTNGSRSLIGRAAWCPALHGHAFASYLIRYRFGDKVDPRYVVAAVSSPHIRRELEERAASTAGQYNLSLAKLNPIQIPLPPLEEQQSFLAERSRWREQVNRLEAEIVGARQRGETLRRAVLSAAYAGQLVPQLADEEAAAELLERIRAPKSAQNPRSKKKASP